MSLEIQQAIEYLKDPIGKSLEEHEAVVKLAVKVLEDADYGKLWESAVFCKDCKHAVYATTIDCAYRCTKGDSPCRGRITYADFGCNYGEEKNDNDSDFLRTGY